MVEFPLALMEGLPVWMRAALVTLIILSVLALLILDRLIPQNSRDRLSWWRVILRYLRERADLRRTASRKERTFGRHRV
ncbi:hypothetical protein ACWDRR_28810 [Kitasatospora sp. NPDC003701]